MKTSRILSVLVAVTTLIFVSPAMADDAAEKKAEPAAAKKEAPAAANTADASDVAKNAINVELGGNGFLYSLNYERKVMDDLGVRIGFSQLSLSADSTDPSGVTGKVEWSITMIPITVNYLLRSKGSNHSLELGAGVTPIFVSVTGNVSDGTKPLIDFGAEGTAWVPSGVFGYRYEPYDGGFQFRIGLSPMYLIAGDESATFPLPYMSLGGAF